MLTSHSAPDIALPEDLSPEIRSLETESEVKHAPILPNTLKRLRIKTIPERIGADVSTVVTYMALPVFINAAIGFVPLQRNLFEELTESIYYRCNLHREVLLGISYEGATAGKEAVSYTTALVVLSFAVFIPAGLYQLINYLNTRKDYAKLAAQLKRLDFEIRSGHFSLSPNKLTLAIQKVADQISLHSEVSRLALQVYFGKLNKVKRIAKADYINRRNLQEELDLEFDIVPSEWEKFCDNSQWVRNEASRYLKPIALISVVPGLLKMIYASYELSKYIDCSITTLLLDTCKESDQYDMMALEVYPWMFTSFSILTFLFIVTAIQLITYPFEACRNFRNKIYAWHEPIEKWGKDKERWVFKDLSWSFSSSVLLPAAFIFSLYRSINLVNAYAKSIGCESFGHVLLAATPFLDDTNPHVCTAAQKSMVFSGFLGDCEIGKFYFLYASSYLFNLLVATLSEHLFNFKRRFSLDSAIALQEVLKEQSDRSADYAKKTIFVTGCFIFFMAKHLADHVCSEGLEVSYPIPTLANSTLVDFPINNSTLPAAFHAFCPYDDLKAIIINKLGNVTWSDFNSTFPKVIDMLTTLPVSVINNATLLVGLAPRCEDYNVLNAFVSDLLNHNDSCNNKVKIRSLATFVAFFWMAISLIGGKVYFGSELIQNVILAIKKIKGTSLAAQSPLPPRINPPIIEELKEPLLEREAPRHKDSCMDRVYRFFKCKKTSLAQESELSAYPHSPRLSLI